MTNEEKREYLNLKIAYQSTPFVAELEKRNEYIKKTPKSLYKYRNFDEYTIDMIENDYVFLTPTGWLDDPFECLTSVDLDRIFDNDRKTLSNEMMEYIVDIIFTHSDSNHLDKEKLLSLLDESTINGEISHEVLNANLDSFDKLSLSEKDLLLNVMINFQNTMSTITDDMALKNLFMILIQSKDKIGVCSFTTKRDNKPMWSLYADKYCGYCIEYDTPMTKEVLPNLCPVIYTKDFDNNIVKTTFKFGIETIIRFFSSGRMKTNMGCFTELLCTKDSDWEYQDEWRLVGDAKTKVMPFKVKNIYLGFNVSKENEKLIVDLSKRKEFGVFKMENPSGNNKVYYTKL